jgi:hypothetical protein
VAYLAVAVRPMSERQRGRPREFDGPPVSIRLPATLHDELSREAVQRRVDLSDVIRERLDHFRISKVDRRDGARQTT